MADSQCISRLLNPWTLHLQKLGLELKCPLCLKLMEKPILLPCNHIFCNFCVPEYGPECPVCKHQFNNRDLRPAPYIENIVTIYRSMDSALNGIISPSLSSGRSLQQSPRSGSSAQGQSPMKTSNVKPDRSVMPPSPSVKRLAQNENAMLLNDVNGCSSLPTVAALSGNIVDGRPSAEEIDVNHLPQQSPVSYISSDDNKEVDGNSSEIAVCKDLGFAKTANLSSVDGQLVNASEIDCRSRDTDDTSCERDTKRQKKMNTGLSSEAKSKSAIANCDPFLTGCAFCKSPNATDSSGPIIFYNKGKEFVDHLPDSIPVHRRCIDWAPQIYYEGEFIKNFKSELARSAKLKCNVCGQKGAALGCYMKSCPKTYHAPCAFEIEECRWDLDNFLMLCPNHISTRFPNEKPKSRKSATSENHINSSKITAEQLDIWSTSPEGPKEWVLCGSALSSDDKCTLIKFAKMCGATVSKLWSSDVTHVIAAADSEGACTRTLKVLMAILCGKWILSMDWVRACMKANCPVNEEPFEINLDNHGCCNGPKTGRLRASSNAPKLFEGLRFYPSGDFLAAYLKDLLELTKVAGGTILKGKEEVIAAKGQDRGQSDHPTCLIVYNCDPPRECMPKEESSIMLRRLEEAENLAKLSGSLVIKHTWILESIAACKLLSFV